MESARLRKKRVENYTPLAKEDELDGFVDEQFVSTHPQIPWKTLLFVLTLFIIGIVCFVTTILISAGKLDVKYDDRLFTLLIVGILTFIPGGYFFYIIMCILLKRGDFSWDDVPRF